MSFGSEGQGFSFDNSDARNMWTSGPLIQAMYESLPRELRAQDDSVMAGEFSLIGLSESMRRVAIDLVGIEFGLGQVRQARVVMGG